MPTPHRRAVLRSSLLLGALGWLTMFALMWAHGEGAGVMASYVFAVTVAITGTVVAAATAVMPDQARIYALGFRDGQGITETPEPKEPTRLLSAVR